VNPFNLRHGRVTPPSFAGAATQYAVVRVAASRPVACQPTGIAGEKRIIGRLGDRLAEEEKAMDHSMRMVLIAGVLMLALLIAIVGSVSADAPIWVSAATVVDPVSQPL
jgi:hypothetical protein